MPPKKKTEGERRAEKRVMVQQDQSEILEEVGAELDEETGELLVDAERVREIGAVDVGAVIENRRQKEFIDKKRGGEKVTFNTDDPLQRYEMLIATWPPNTIDIYVRRLTGAAAQHVITSRPRSGTELYEAIKQQIHREHPEADYELKFNDSNHKVWRGTGRITMPDTRPTGGASMNQTYYPQQPPQAPPVVTAPVTPPVAPQQPQDMNGMMNTVQGMFELFQRMQPKPEPAAPAAPPPPPIIQMPPQPAANDPAGQLVWIQQMFEMFQKMQPPGAPPVAAPVPAPAPVVVQPPPPPPQDSMASTMTMMQQMFELFQKMQPQQPQPQRRPAYYPQEDRDPRGERYREAYEPRREPRGYDPRDPRGYPQHQPPPPPRTPADELRDAMSVMRTTMQSLQEFQAMLPQQQQRQEPVAQGVDDDDDSPIQMVEAGPAKLVFDRSSGDLRTIESLGANLPTAFKWVGEQLQELSKSQQRAQGQTRQQLPPGFVEVTPGYEPPPGYVAVSIEQEERLPPPPERMPPPVRQQAPQAPQQAWGAPPVQTWGAPTTPAPPPPEEPEEVAPWGDPPDQEEE